MRNELRNEQWGLGFCSEIGGLIGSETKLPPESFGCFRESIELRFHGSADDTAEDRNDLAGASMAKRIWAQAAGWFSVRYSFFIRWGRQARLRLPETRLGGSVSSPGTFSDGPASLLQALLLLGTQSKAMHIRKIRSDPAHSMGNEPGLAAQTFRCNQTSDGPHHPPECLVRTIHRRSSRCVTHRLDLR